MEQLSGAKSKSADLFRSSFFVEQNIYEGRRKMNDRNQNVNIEPNFESVSEYKIGHTTYIVVTRFDFTGESLNDVIRRLIVRNINNSAA